ncbi:hypothetical protein OSI22_25245, partial [Mycobacterium ulcerans]
MTAAPAVPAGSVARLALVGATVPAVLAVPVVLAVWVLIVGWRRGPVGPVALVAPAVPGVGLDPVLVAWVPVVTAGPVVPAVPVVWAVAVALVVRARPWLVPLVAAAGAG